jgi:ribosomal protein L11 methyltransferase
VTVTWSRITITAGPERVDAIAAAVVEATGQGVEEPRAGVICTIIESEGAARSLATLLRHQFDGLDVAVEATVPVDWSTRWRDGIVTRSFGRLVLTPSWLPVAPHDNLVVVSIDPESAFGSGEHGSTRGALALLERTLAVRDRVLDLGSGSGILAIAAVKLGARAAIGIEVDADALPIADENARKNGAARAVRFLVGDAAQLAPLAGPAELICSNILRSVNTSLMPAILEALAPRGTVIFAGMEEDEAPLFRPVLEAHALHVVDEVSDAGWWSVAVRRR